MSTCPSRRLTDLAALPAGHAGLDIRECALDGDRDAVRLGLAARLAVYATIYQ